MSIAVLDTSIIMILAGKPAPARGMERVLDLIHDHERRGDKIALTSSGLAECSHFSDALWNSFVILSLNTAAAILANKLTLGMRADGKGKARRPELTIDALILGTAETHSASFLYSTDPWFKKAQERHKLRIKCRELPEPTHKQLPLSAGQF